MTLKTAFFFPGQGSQSVGMLADLSDNSTVRDTFTEASAVLGYDLWQQCQEGPADVLNQTQVTQPALLTVSVALWRLWNERGGKRPDYLAGHSLGEYSALVCAESIEFADAVSLVKARGEFMQQAVPPGVGAMAAVIGLADDVVINACAEAEQGETVAAVNFNSPGQVVIAGHAAAVTRAEAVCKEAGAKRVLMLPVSVPSHCLLMKPAADMLAERLAGIAIQAPLIPVVNNVDVVTAATSDAIRDALVRQLSNPVRWTETVQWLAEQGVTNALEIGAGKVLSGLAKRIDKRIQCQSVNRLDSLEKSL